MRRGTEQSCRTKATSLARALERRRADPTQLLQILREIQEETGWISPEISAFGRASGLGVPTTQVESVVQFYAFLYDQPRGRYRILFSDNITDRMLGSLTLFESHAEAPEAAPGRSLSRRAVSVDLTSCTGMCDQGPALLVNNRAITRLTARRVDEICDLVRGGVPLAEWPADHFPRRRQHPPRRRPARLALRARVRPTGRDRASGGRACSTK